MNLPIVGRIPGRITTMAVVYGILAILRAWRVLYPSRHTGFTGTTPWIAFEVIKAAVLFSILARVYFLNSKENEQAARSQNVYNFAMAAGVSVLIDTAITLSKM